tara:strand:+ start:1990 stop:2391 length:402 start_codon:yes stop_codon:yes gene_type:complete
LDKIQQWADDLSMLDENDRLMHIIELAKNKTSLPKELRTESRLVRGCMSQIWVDVGLVDEKVQVYYDSDAMITKGITSIVCDCFSDISLQQAKTLTPESFEALGIKQLLSAQRRNGLGSLIGTIIKRINIING